MAGVGAWIEGRRVIASLAGWLNSQGGALQSLDSPGSPMALVDKALQPRGSDPLLSPFSQLHEEAGPIHMQGNTALDDARVHHAHLPSQTVHSPSH